MDKFVYEERVQSFRTSLLFVILASIFFGLFAWRFAIVGFRFVPGLYLTLALLFLFYVINYRELRIQITENDLRLKFGLISWKLELGNIKEAFLDDSPPLIRFGGAGVHFAFVSGEYRAFFNFLEFPRVTLRFHSKQGPVRALVITTRHPDQVLQIVGN